MRQSGEKMILFNARSTAQLYQIYSALRATNVPSIKVYEVVYCSVMHYCVTHRVIILVSPSYYVL